MAGREYDGRGRKRVFFTRAGRACFCRRRRFSWRCLLPDAHAGYTTAGGFKADAGGAEAEFAAVRFDGFTHAVDDAGQPVGAAGLETVTISSPSRRSTSSTWTPSRPSSKSQREHGQAAEHASAHPELS